MCNVPCCTFCAMVSVFGTFFMFLLGILIKNNYQFIGEWYEPEEGKHAPSEEQISKASTSCFIVGGMYIGFLVFSLASVCFLRMKAKRS